MAQIVTITNPLTGQPAQVDQLEHTAQEIDDAIARALPGGAIDIALQNKLGGIESTEYPGCYYRMVDGVVEWFNPPMQVGGIDADGNQINEYRTTERYMGKPVYAKLIDFGPGANNTEKSVEHGARNAIVIDFGGYAKFGNGTLSVPWLSHSTLSVSSTVIIMTADANYSGYNVYVWIKYYKTTD